MRKVSSLLLAAAIFLLFLNPRLLAQKIEEVKGVRIIHNSQKGQWDKKSQVSLKLVQTIGDIEAEEDNLAFYLPSDMAIDNEGNIYILDAGNHRLQKFNAQGQFMDSIGHKGQGPGEFYFPTSVDVDSNGFLYISDPNNQRIQILKSDGKEFKTIRLIKEPIGPIRFLKKGVLAISSSGSSISFNPGGWEEENKLPRLIKTINLEGQVLKRFGDAFDYKNILLNKVGNSFNFDVDREGNFYLAFHHQNRIEQYSPEGKLLWRADRKLPYSTAPPKNKGKMEARGGNRIIQMPQMNRCSNGIAVDEAGRIWVVGLKRQIKKEERVDTAVRAMMSESGEKTLSFSLRGNTGLQNTDMYQLEIYSPEGILLGKIQLNHFVDSIRIKNNRLFLIDKNRGAKVYIYKILEN